MSRHKTPLKPTKALLNSGFCSALPIPPWENGSFDECKNKQISLSKMIFLNFCQIKEKKLKNQNIRQSKTTMLGEEEEFNPTAFIFCLSAKFHIHIRHLFQLKLLSSSLPTLWKSSSWQHSFMFSSKRLCGVEKNGTFMKLISIKSTAYCAQHSHIRTVKKGTNYCNLKGKKKKLQGIM